MTRNAKITLPDAPVMQEIAPGAFDVDQMALNQYEKDMVAAKALWDQTMAGAEDDPDEIMHRMFGLFK